MGGDPAHSYQQDGEALRGADGKAPAGRVQMNPPTCADIIKLTKLGMLDREIAEKFNMDRKQIGRIRRLHNIKPGYEHRKNQVQAMRSTDHDNIITLMKKQTAQEAMWVDKLNGRVFESLKMKPMQEKKMPRNMEHIPTRSVLDNCG